MWQNMKSLKNLFIHFKKIFEREHLIRTFWGIVSAGIFFLVGIWYNSNKGPSKVEIINTPKTSDTVIVRFNKDIQSPEKMISFYFNEISKQLSDPKKQQLNISSDKSNMTNSSTNISKIPEIDIKDSRLELSSKQKLMEQFL